METIRIKIINIQHVRELYQVYEVKFLKPNSINSNQIFQLMVSHHLEYSENIYYTECEGTYEIDGVLH